MRKICLIYIFISLLLFSDAYAVKPSIKNNTVIPNDFRQSESLPWSLEMGLGYGRFQHTYSDDGYTVITRMGIGKQFAYYNRMLFGLEIAVQSGNIARLDVPQSTLNILGGLPIETTIKPMLDLLLTSKFYFPKSHAVFFQLKGGLILQRLQFNRGSINDLTKVYPELQLGLGYDVNHWGSLSLSYQRIFGKDPQFKIVSQDCYSRVSNIPGMNSVILGLSIRLDGVMMT